MKTMDFSILLDWISDIYDIITYTSDINFPIQQLRILDETTPICQDNFLYLTKDWGLAIKYQSAASHIIVCFTPDCATPSYPCPSSSQISILYTDSSFFTVFRAIQDIFDHYQNWYESVIHMILEEKDLSEILDQATFYLKNPVALFDPTGTVLYYTDNFQQDIHDTLWEEVTTLGFTPTEFILPDEHKRIMREIHEGHKMISSTFRQDPDHHALTVPIYINEKSFGAFGMTDINAPFTFSQKALILDLCQLTGLALKHRTKPPFLRDENDYFVTRLLQGFQPDERTTNYYLESKNFQNNDIWYLYQFPLPESDYAQPRRYSYINQIQRILANAILLPFENSIIAVCRKIDFDLNQEKNIKKLESLLKRISLKVFISSQFMHFTDLSIAYGQCKIMENYASAADSLIQRFEHSFQTVFYGILQNQISLKGFCHPTLLSMWQSHTEQNQTLIYNLKCYLLNGRNIAETARSLHLHRNTFLYRLRKIETQLNLSLDYLDENMLLFLLISCMICETLN